MPTAMEMAQALEGSSPPTQTPGLSDYEQSREKRIKENRERLQKLGIVDLSLQLSSLRPRKRAPRNQSGQDATRSFSMSPPSGPRRRSSRLQSVTPVNYSEEDRAKKGKPWEDEEDILREEGSKPEAYTAEHEKLLGTTERSWTLFVDGYGKDGKRIYDQVKGKTCHQCRQKTLGYRTHCSKCNMVQGQFCGDCLYMRYGEHVLEALANPNWICPVCRGICNCSLCRQAKGWPPTGTLYKKVSRMGYKSVAHYLIQTRRAENNLAKGPESVDLFSAKRSLTFSDTTLSMESSKVSDKKDPGSLEPESQDKKKDHELKSETGSGNINQISAKRSLPFGDMASPKTLKSKMVYESKHLSENKGDHESETGSGNINQISAKRSLPFGDMASSKTLKSKMVYESKHLSENKGDHESKEQEIHPVDEAQIARDIVPGSLTELERSAFITEPHLMVNNGHDAKSRTEKTSDCTVLNNDLSKPDEEKGSTCKQSTPGLTKRRRAATVTSPDSIAARLKQRRRKDAVCASET